MPEAQHINGFPVGKNFVDDPVCAVDDFADGWLANLRYHPVKFWKSGGGKCAVNQFIAKSSGASRIVSGDEGDDLLQIVQ